MHEGFWTDAAHCDRNDWQVVVEEMTDRPEGSCIQEKERVLLKNHFTVLDDDGSSDRH